MPGKPLDGNWKWIVGLVSLLVMLAGIVFAAGGMSGRVEGNTKDISELKVDLKEQIQKVDEKLDGLIEFLMKQ